MRKGRPKFSALAACNRIDECHEWANKAEALASYAKMADDDSGKWPTASKPVRCDDVGSC